jgi:hypothetical protein
MYELLSVGMYECGDLSEGGIFLREDTGVSVSMTELRAAARDYLADNYPGQKAATHDLINRAVREWFGAEVVTRRAQRNNVRWVDFPALPECRDHVRRTKGLEISPPVEAPVIAPQRGPARLRAV